MAALATLPNPATRRPRRRVIAAAAIRLMRPGPCSGTQIADGLVLTAARCICGDEPRCDAPDVPGSFLFTNVPVRNGDSPATVEYLVSDAYVHPDDEVGVAQSDIAVLELVPRKPSEVAADGLPLPLATAFRTSTIS